MQARYQPVPNQELLAGEDDYLSSDPHAGTHPAIDNGLISYEVHAVHTIQPRWQGHFRADKIQLNLPIRATY
jgi:hypothetical protein